MVKVFLTLITLISLSSCILFKPRVETVEKTVVEKQVVTEKGDTITLYDTITKTEIKDRWLEREETKRERQALRNALKLQRNQNKFLEDSLNIVRKQNSDNNKTIEYLEKQETKQGRIVSRTEKALERQISKQKKQEEKTKRVIFWLIFLCVLLLALLVGYIIYKRVKNG